jgi:hypothetical protein
VHSPTSGTNFSEPKIIANSVAGSTYRQQDNTNMRLDKDTSIALRILPSKTAEGLLPCIKTFVQQVYEPTLGAASTPALPLAS